MFSSIQPFIPLFPDGARFEPPVPDASSVTWGRGGSARRAAGGYLTSQHLSCQHLSGLSLKDTVYDGAIHPFDRGDDIVAKRGFVGFPAADPFDVVLELFYGHDRQT